MSKMNKLNPFSAAVGAAVVVGSLAGTVQAELPSFNTSDLKSGYTLAEKDAEGKCGEGKCGEGKCGEEKSAEGKCGEGKCGEGKCGEEKSGEEKSGEGKCGEGKCGGDA